MHFNGGDNEVNDKRHFSLLSKYEMSSELIMSYARIERMKDGHIPNNCTSEKFGYTPLVQIFMSVASRLFFLAVEKWYFIAD